MAEKKRNDATNVIYVVLIVTAFLFLIISGYKFFQDSAELSRISTIDSIGLRINSLSTDLNIFPRTSLNDISYLSSISNTIEILNGEDGSYHNDLLEFLEQNSAYYQIILLDANCSEVLRIENPNNNHTSSSSFGGDDEFLEKIKRLEQKEVIVSDIFPENNGNGIFPSLTYATIIYWNNTKIGYIILKADANYFLDDIRYARRDGEVAYLIRSNGEYIANPDSEKEFDLNEYSVYEDYPELDSKIISRRIKFIENTDYLFSFEYITISKGYFTRYSEDDEYLWILVLVSDKSEVNMPSLKDFIIYEFPAYLVLILLLIFFLFKRRRRNEK